jgi:CheY-like chemotaxis protein
VLVVEDNERNSRLACAVLEVAGMTPHSVATGHEALAHCRGEAPDVVLLDVQLPDRSGVEVLADLRANPATAGIPVAALTAFAMAGDRERLLASGFDEYISKPIDVATFAQTVSALIRDRA